MIKKDLARALEIKNPKKEDIFGIVGRMEVLLECLKSDSRHKGLIPFLQTYYLITKAVAEKKLKHPRFFKQPDKLDALDVHFASLYFHPLKLFLEKGQAVKPWQTYFSYCQQPNGAPFLQMLLGINAHINADLTSSLIALGYDQKEDYLAINKILHEQIPAIMKFLALTEHDWIGLGALFMKKFTEQEFRKIIVGWRLRAWENAQDRRNNRHIILQTEKIGQELIKTFDNLSHLKHLNHITQQVNSLRV